MPWASWNPDPNVVFGVTEADAGDTLADKVERLIAAKLGGDVDAAVELLAMATLEATSGRIDVWPPDPLDPETANRIYKMARRIDQDRSDSGGGY